MLKKIILPLVLFLLCTAIVAMATTDGQVPEPARPMPYTDFISITQTGQMDLTTNPVKLTTGGYILIYNESGDIVRVGTDTNLLNNGFGLPANSALKLRLWKGQVLYVAASGTAKISYIKGN